MTGWPGTESPVRREHVAFGAGSVRATPPRIALAEATWPAWFAIHVERSCCDGNRRNPVGGTRAELDATGEQARRAADEPLERGVRRERFQAVDRWEADRRCRHPRRDQPRDRAGSDNRAPRRSGPA